MPQKSFTASEAKTHFGEFLDQAQRGPVQVTRRQRVVGVLVSADDYEAMRAFYANRLQSTLAHAGDYAAQQGLTEQALQDLLADDR